MQKLYYLDEWVKTYKAGLKRDDDYCAMCKQIRSELESLDYGDRNQVEHVLKARVDVLMKIDKALRTQGVQAYNWLTMEQRAIANCQSELWRCKEQHDQMVEEGCGSCESESPGSHVEKNARCLDGQ